jgi:hypothetical protein
MPLYPFIVLEVGSAFRVSTFYNYVLVSPQVGSPRDLGVRQKWIIVVQEKLILCAGREDKGHTSEGMS